MAGGPRVGIIMGSQSDWATMTHAAQTLEALDVMHETRIVSAHRTPDRLAAYAAAAQERGLAIIIAGAGGAAHLPGMCAAWTALPVLGVPVQSATLAGMDSLLSIVQMPAGIPVGTLAIGRAGAVNAALLAASILALSDEALAGRFARLACGTDRRGRRNPIRAVTPLPPNATIGIVGGGQLGRMSAMAAARLGYRCHILAEEPGGPGQLVAAGATIGRIEDPAVLQAFAQHVDVVTFEFENVSAEGLDLLASLRPVHPSPAILRLTQERVAEKSFVNAAGIATAPWRAVGSREDLDEAVAAIGLPAVLKTTRLGYDGRGQAMLRQPADLDAAWASLSPKPLILEGFVDFACEISVIVARGADGSVAVFDAVENRHRHHILDLTLAPARVAPDIAAAAQAVALDLAAALDLRGLLAVEMFVDRDARVLVNELAPRPHNSGHWTIDACPASQFEMHVRAVAGLKLPEAARHSDAVMKNLVGPEELALWPAILETPGLIPHLYGKTRAAPGRKMGHVTRLFPRGALPGEFGVAASLGRSLGAALEPGAAPQA